MNTAPKLHEHITLAPPSGEAEVPYGYVTQTAFYRSREVAESNYNSEQIAAGKLVPVFRAPPSAIPVDALRGLAEEWRRFAGFCAKKSDASAYNACADELAALIGEKA